jgi:hypothetical protein
MSQQLGELVVKKCVPEEFTDCDIVFSGLDSDVAGDVGTYTRNWFQEETQACRG